MKNDDEDNSDPYALAREPDPREPCPRCTKMVPEDAVVCHHCGFDRHTGATLERVWEKVDREWEAGLGFRLRLGIFLSLQAMFLALMLMNGLEDSSLAAWIATWTFATAAGAFVTGTYGRINLHRSTKGKLKLTKTWRFCFLPLKTEAIRWQEYLSIALAQSLDSFDFWDWLVFVIVIPEYVVHAFLLPLILMPLYFLPLVLWWLFVIRPEKFEVALRNDTDTPLLLYRGQSEDMARDIADTLRGVTDLR